MTFITCDTNGNCKVLDDDTVQPECRNIDRASGPDVSMEQAAYVGEVRQILPAEQSAWISHAARPQTTISR